MGFAERVKRESLVRTNETIDPLEIAGGLCGPWLNDNQWSKVRSNLENWEAKKKEANKDEDKLGSLIKDMKEMTVTAAERP
jgi:hypothetical protein